VSRPRSCRAAAPGGGIAGRRDYARNPSNHLSKRFEGFCQFSLHPCILFLVIGALSTAQRTIQDYEARPMLRKGQLERVAKGDVLAQNRIINQLFGLAASRALTSFSLYSHEFLQYNHVESHTSSAV
jgi:hypothetical protein